MSRLWIDPSCGASGDMFLGALADLGAVDPAGVPAALGLDATVTVEPTRRAGLAATAVTVRPGADQPVRTWSAIRGVIEAADLPEPVRVRSLATFARLAVAEAAVHGVGVDEVHFHEVGAVDSLVDVVGACAGLAALAATDVTSAPVALGGGSVRAAHGVLPVPVPAVLRLLADASAPGYGGPVERELCTPTGAALLAEHVTSWGPMPAMAVRATGTGAGGRDLPDRPNVLRLVTGDPLETPRTEPVLMQTNVDDLDPRLWPSVLASLLAAGADDAWLTPILMKKGRPAHTLSVLTGDGRLDAVRRVVFTETSSLGLRENRVGKVALERRMTSVVVDGRTIAVKLGLQDGEVVNAQPEWEDVAAAAAALGRPAKAVLAAAVAATHDARSGA